jgi:beta-lactamase regulating signal transducer with metallopeptidase domain
VDLLLYVGLSNALAATLLAVAVAAVARLCRRPALEHALWLLVLLKLITPPLLPVSLPWSDPFAAEPAPVERPVPVALVFPRQGPFDVPPRLGDLPDEQAAADPAPEPGKDAGPVAPPPAQPTQTALPPAWPGWKPVLLSAWLTGSAFWWLLACLRVARFRRLLRHTRPAPADVQEQARRLAGRLGLASCPGVWLVPARVSPLLWALGRSPRLLLPADLWQALTPEQRDTLLAHELAHLRRRDHWVRRLELVVLGLFWWHPVAWWARHELAEAEEACCDGWVLWALPEAGPAYAAALVETLAFLSRARRPVPVAASGAGRVKILKRRLFMILQRPSPRALSGAGLFAVLGFGCLLLPLLPTWAEQRPGERRGDADPAPAAVAKKPTDPQTTPAGGRTVTVPDPLLAAGEGRDVRVPDPEAPRPDTAAPRNLAAEIAKIRDEMELLEAQLAVKRARLKAAQAYLEQAEHKFARCLKLHESRSVSAEELQQAQAEVAAQKAQVAIKEAELHEPEVRMAQAYRRLTALQGRASGPGDAAKRSWAEALFDRQKVEILLVEGGMGRCLFRLTNTTKETLHISALRTSSGAVSATTSVKTLMPGQQAVITVTVDGRRFKGGKAFTVHVGTVHVGFDKPRPAEVELVVRASVADTRKPDLPLPQDAKKDGNGLAKGLAAQGEPGADKALKLAFGDGCPELQRAIRVFWRRAGVVIAADELKIMANGRLRLDPCSIALFNRDRTTITSLRTARAFISLDRPITGLSELGQRQLTAIECADGMVIKLDARKLDLPLRQGAELRPMVPLSEPSQGAKESDIFHFQINQRTFKLPFQLAPDQLGQMREVVLYGSNDQGKSWQRMAAQSPDSDSFTVTVPRDGLYWFSVATIDMTGRQQPERIALPPPALKVLVQSNG